MFVKNKIAMIPNLWKKENFAGARSRARSEDFTVQRMEQKMLPIHIVHLSSL